MVAGPGEAGFESVGEDVGQTETGESSEAQVSLDRATFDAAAEIQIREDLTVQASEELEQEVRDAVEAVLDTAAADPTEITFSPDDVQVDGAGEGGMAIGAAPVETDSVSVEVTVEGEEAATPPAAADSGIVPSSPLETGGSEETVQDQIEAQTGAVQGAMDALSTARESQEVITAQIDELQASQSDAEKDSGQVTQEEPSTSPDAQEMEHYFEPERTTLQDKAEAMTAQDEGNDKPDSADPLSVNELLHSQQIHAGLIGDDPVESIEGEDQADASTVVGRSAPSRTELAEDSQEEASEEQDLEQDENDLMDSMPERTRVGAAGSSNRSSFERSPTSEDQRGASDSPEESIEGEPQADATHEVELVINEAADSDSTEGTDDTAGAAPPPEGADSGVAPSSPPVSGGSDYNNLSTFESNAQTVLDQIEGQVGSIQAAVDDLRSADEDLEGMAAQLDEQHQDPSEGESRVDENLESLTIEASPQPGVSEGMESNQLPIQDSHNTLQRQQSIEMLQGMSSALQDVLDAVGRTEDQGSSQPDNQPGTEGLTEGEVNDPARLEAIALINALQRDQQLLLAVSQMSDLLQDTILSEIRKISGDGEATQGNPEQPGGSDEGQGASMDASQTDTSDMIDLSDQVGSLEDAMQNAQQAVQITSNILHNIHDADNPLIENLRGGEDQGSVSNSLVESIEGEDQVAGTADVELVINEGADSVSEDYDFSDLASDFSDISSGTFMSMFLKLNIEDPAYEPPPEFDRSASVEAVSGTEALIHNYEQTIEVLEADLQQLLELLDEYQAMPEGSQSSESFTLHLPVQSADGTYQLIGMPVSLSSATIQTWIPVLQTAILQVQMQMAAIE